MSLFPTSRKDAFECMLIGTSSHPVTLISTLVVAVATPSLLLPIEETLLQDSKHHLHLGLLCVIGAVGFLLLLGLIWQRRKGRGDDDQQEERFLLFGFLGHRSLEPSFSQKRVFLLWQMCFSVALALTFLFFDFLLFPAHSRKLVVYDYEGIGDLVVHPVLSVWSYIRPLSMIGATLGWMTLLGWWADERTFQRRPAHID